VSVRGEEEKARLLKASEYVRSAITILDTAGAPEDIAAHLDLAAERIRDLMGDHSRRSNGSDDDSERMVSSG
jgi:hypothetical protein